MTNQLKLANYFRAGYPVLYLLTAEESRADAIILAAAKESKRTLKVWSHTDGLVNPETPSENKSSVTDPSEALALVAKDTGKGFVYIFKDLHKFFNIPKVLRLIRDRARDNKQTGKTIVILSPVSSIPPEIERDVVLLDLELPNQKDMLELFEQMKISCAEALKKVTISTDEQDKIVTACLGLTTPEAENAVAKAIVEHVKTDISTRESISKIVLREKALAVKKTGILEYSESNETANDIGGLYELKSWLMQRQKAFTKEAREFGLPLPRGIILVGLPGCGKSLTAKVASNIMKVPLIRFDVSRVFAGIVGQSESQMRLVLNTIDAIGSCLTADTKITMDDGLEKFICDIKPGEKVACYNELDGKITKTTVNAVRSKKEQTVKITLQSGNIIKSTLDHKHLTLEHGQIKWKKTNEFTIGDRIALAIKQPYTDYKSTFDFIPSDVMVYGFNKNDNRVPKTAKYETPFIRIKDFNEQEWLIKSNTRIATGKGRYQSIVENIPTSLNNDILYVLGLLMSDGSIFESRFVVYNANTTLLDTFETIVSKWGLKFKRRESEADYKYESYKKLPGITLTPTLSKIYVSTVSNKLMTRILLNIKKNLLSISPNLLEYWLAGYIDGDGSTSNENNDDKITLCVKKQHNAEILHSVVQKLGIVPSKWNGQSLEITGVRARDLAIKLLHKVKHPNKHNNLSNIMKSDVSNARRDSSFHIGKLIKIERNKKNIPSTAFRISSSMVSRYEHGNSCPEDKLMILNETLCSKDIDFLLQADVRWVEIKSIEDNDEQVVYDLSCDGLHTHNFIANGLITHNCVVWMDEMEKAFAGMGGGEGGTQDSGVSRRIFGTLITWMNDKKGGSFLIGTVNRIESLPDELLRKGRFDEIFFTPLPNDKEREEIFKIQVKKYGRDPKILLLDELIKKSNGFSGAEIEDCIRQGLYTAFDLGKELSSDHILSAAMNLVPLSVSRKDQLDKMKKWAEDNAVNATEKRNVKKTYERIDI